MRPKRGHQEGFDVILADTPASSGGSSLYTIGLFVLIGAVFYFLVLRPQNRRRREQASMQSNLGVGDEIQTVGGLFGTVTEVDGDVVTIEAAPGVELRYAAGAIARVVTRAASDEQDEHESEDDHDGNADAAKTIEQA
jgi:preprotein translocase subunit YajC